MEQEERQVITFTCPACGHVEKVLADAPQAPQSNVAAAQQVFAGDIKEGPNPPTCPVHGYEWKKNSRGYFCSGKSAGKWCEQKPA